MRRQRAEDPRCVWISSSRRRVVPTSPARRSRPVISSPDTLFLLFERARQERFVSVPDARNTQERRLTTITTGEYGAVLRGTGARLERVITLSFTDAWSVPAKAMTRLRFSST